MAITYEQLVDALRDETYLVVDVGEPAEFEEGHIPGAINVPLSRFDPKALPQMADRFALSGRRALRRSTKTGHQHGGSATFGITHRGPLGGAG
jgi:3-mercaptopyruvate sulfurtransferase SseA